MEEGVWERMDICTWLCPHAHLPVDHNIVNHLPYPNAKQKVQKKKKSHDTTKNK